MYNYPEIYNILKYNYPEMCNKNKIQRYTEMFNKTEIYQNKYT